MSDVIEQLERVNKQMFNRVAIYNNMRPISPNQFELSGIVHKLIEEDWVPLVTAAISELKQLRADVARMPVTADGKRILPGDYVYHADARGPFMIVGNDEHYFDEYKNDNGKDAPEDTEFFAYWFYYENDTGYRESWCKLVSDCYSTESAALEAAKKGE